MEQNDKRPDPQDSAQRPITDTNQVRRPNLPSGQDPAKAPNHPGATNRTEAMNRLEEPNRPDASNRPELTNRTEEPNPITDPQESMEGPVSSFIQGIKHRAEKNDEEEQEEHQYKETHSGGDFINK